MSKNLTPRSRALRVFLGFSIIGVGFTYHSWLGAIGLLPILAALTGFCPLCKIFPKSGCSVEKPGDDQGGKKGGCGCSH